MADVDKDFERRLGRIEELIAHIEASPDAMVRSNARELVQTLLDMHRLGIERLFESLATTEAGVSAAVKSTSDPLVGSLLMLHDLHPISLEQRVRAGLDKVRPYLKSHGGGVTLLGIERDRVSLRLEGSCNGCPSSSMTMKLAVEDAILELAPDVRGIEVEGVVAPGAPKPDTSGLVQLRSVKKKQLDDVEADIRGTWQDVFGLPESDGAVAARDVGGHSLLLCRVGESIYAYRDVCPSCSSPLGATTSAEGEIACRSCATSFDVRRAGRSTQASFHLEPLPLLVDGSRAKVALPSLVATPAVASPA